MTDLQNQNAREPDSEPDTHHAPLALAVSGMTCGGCASAVKAVLMRVSGVSEADVQFKTGRAEIVGTAKPQDLVHALRGAGYEAHPI